MGKAVVLITGASRGIGRGIARTLAAQGYDIAATATRMRSFDGEGDQEAFADEIKRFGVDCCCVDGDITDIAGHQPLLDRVLAHYGRVDMLVNNAGVAPLQRMDLMECTEESYDRVMNTNLKGPFFFTRCVAGQMIAQVKAGTAYRPRIVFISSISSRVASTGRMEYCLSKAGLTMAARGYAVRLAAEGIPVFTLEPGIIATDMTAGVQEKYDRMIADGLLLTPRWGTPEDIGRAVTALAEGYFDYATGAEIEIGGGFSVPRL